MRRSRRVLWLFVVALSSVGGWFLTGLVSAETFMPLALSYSGVGEDVAGPIVRRLYAAMRVGAAIGPWICACAWITIRVIVARREALDCTAVFVCSAVALALLSFPNPVMPSLPGLDNSWTWMLGKFALTNVIGRDAVFTYGPTGFVLFPQIGMANALLALVANLVHAFLWVFSLVVFYRSGRASHVSAWLLLATVLFPQMNMEWRWVSLAVLLTAVPTVAPTVKRRAGLVACAGGVLAFVCFMKFSSLLIVASAQALILAYGMLRERRMLKTILPWGCAFVSVFGILAFACFDSSASFFNWLRGSLAIASGYNKYMLLPKSYFEVSVPFLALTAVAVALFCRVRERAKLFLIGLAFSPVFFCTTKYALVRQGPFQLFYMLSVFCALMPAVVPALNRRMMAMIIAFLVISAVCLLPRAVAGDSYWHFAFGLNPMGIVRTAMLPIAMRNVADESARRVAPCRLPEEWRAKIGREPLLFMPHEHAPAMGPDAYNLVFLPTFQLYSAYLPQLDACCGELFHQERAPQWIVCSVDPPWSGHFINYPATWLSVFKHYQVDSQHEGRILLRRRESVENSVVDPGQKTSMPGKGRQKSEIRADAWFDCSQWGGCSISIQWPQTDVGHLCSFFLRNTMTFLSLRYKDGTEVTIPVLAENLSHPFPISRIAVVSADFAEVLKGGSARIPVALRFHADSPWIYSKTIQVCVQR